MSTPLSQTLSSLNSTLSFSLGIVHVVFATIGTALNLFVYFRSHTWRTSCGLYLIVSYISGFGVVMAGQLSRLIIPTPTFLLTTFWQCQIRAYLIQSFGLLTRTLIVLASLDRLFLCSTNVRKRQWCQVRKAKWIIPLVFIISFLLPLHIPLSYEYRPFSRTCFSSFEWLITLDFAYQMAFVAIIPGSLIAIFSFKLILCLREQRLRLARELRSRDKQLVLMLLAQVIFYTMIHVIVLASMSYNRITLYHLKTRDRSAIENFITFVVHSQLVYFYFSLTFVLNLLVSPTFRRDLFYFWKKVDSQMTMFRTVTRIGPMNPNLNFNQSISIRP